jgi:hypothetical protein
MMARRTPYVKALLDLGFEVADEDGSYIRLKYGFIATDDYPLNYMWHDHGDRVKEAFEIFGLAILKVPTIEQVKVLINDLGVQ